MNPYKPTRTYNKIHNIAHNYRYIGVQGGQGASKTVSILMMLINECSHGRCEITVLGHELTKLKATAILDFKKILQSWKRWDPEAMTRGSHYKFSNGSFIEFVGLDSSDMGKGLRRDILYFNEANRGIDFETFFQAASRVRHKVFLDWNPDAEFWWHKQMEKRSDAKQIIVTFNDNQFLPEAEREEILRYKDRGYNLDGSVKNSFYANRWRVYGLGEVGIIPETVYTDWDEEWEPKGYVIYGLDWGYEAPTAIVKCYLNERDIYIEEILYKKKLTVGDLVQEMEMLSIPQDAVIYCDSAEPKSIEELNRAGFIALEADKKPGSVDAGIKTVAHHNLHLKGENLINEIKSYSRKRNRDGEITEQIIKANDHLMDAMRYAIYTELKGRGNEYYSKLK